MFMLAARMIPREAWFALAAVIVLQLAGVVDVLAPLVSWLETFIGTQIVDQLTFW